MVALSPAELRKRNNFTLFVNRIKTNGYFTINESNGQKVQITQRLAYQLNSVEDLANLRDNRGSIHSVGAALQGLPACNGWTFWHIKRSGRLIPIDHLRNTIKLTVQTL